MKTFDEMTKCAKMLSQFELKLESRSVDKVELGLHVNFWSHFFNKLSAIFQLAKCNHFSKLSHFGNRMELYVCAFDCFSHPLTIGECFGQVAGRM